MLIWRRSSVEVVVCATATLAKRSAAATSSGLLLDRVTLLPFSLYRDSLTVAFVLHYPSVRRCQLSFAAF
jgi:hypothetical protein